MKAGMAAAAPRRLLLLGAGHAHAQVLRDWARAPLPGVALAIVSPGAMAPYSGMVPGWMAGHYRYDEICIDFAALATAAGAQLITDQVVALDAAAREVRLLGGAVLGYELLSLNIGSTLNPPALPEGVRVLPLRPLGRLRLAWDALLAELAGARADAAPLHMVAVGGGAAGAESLLAVLARLRALQPGRAITATLVSRSERLVPGLARSAARGLQQALAEAGVALRLGQGYDAARHTPADGRQHLLLWATGAEAHAWPAAGGLAASVAGFVRIGPQLRSVSHPEVFAVGDCAEWSPPLPKAGVFAVRMGPVLAHNLKAVLSDQPLQTYRPQRQALALLATGNRHAVAARGPWALSGRWPGRWAGRLLWRWKDRIDRRFIAGFAASVPALPSAPSPTSALEDLP